MLLTTRNCEPEIELPDPACGRCWVGGAGKSSSQARQHPTCWMHPRLRTLPGCASSSGGRSSCTLGSALSPLWPPFAPRKMGHCSGSLPEPIPAAALSPAWRLPCNGISVLWACGVKGSPSDSISLPLALENRAVFAGLPTMVVPSSLALHCPSKEHMTGRLKGEAPREEGRPVQADSGVHAGRPGLPPSHPPSPGAKWALLPQHQGE